MIGLVGVQSNQYPRALDLARQFRAAGLPVAIGGFHVSGCISMLPELPAELKEAQAMGVALFAGEAEEQRLDEVLLDAWNGAMKPLYNFMGTLPSLEGAPWPFLPRKHIERTAGTYTSVDLGRGCPYQCSFCTIINVQGHKSRFRTEFFMLTPLPGSEDHQTMVRNAEWMDPDINKYDPNHRVTHHPKMSDAEWEEAYRCAWSAFYSYEHIRTIVRRAAQIPNGRPKTITRTIAWFRLMIEHEGVHPLEGGALRMKYCRDRRWGLPVELPLRFYPRYWSETAVTARARPRPGLRSLDGLPGKPLRTLPAATFTQVLRQCAVESNCIRMSRHALISLFVLCCHTEGDVT